MSGESCAPSCQGSESLTQGHAGLFKGQTLESGRAFQPHGPPPFIAGPNAPRAHQEVSDALVLACNAKQDIVDRCDDRSPHARLFVYFSDSGFFGCLTRFDVPLRKNPVRRCATCGDEQEHGRSLFESIDDPPSVRQTLVHRRIMPYAVQPGPDGRRCARCLRAAAGNPSPPVAGTRHPTDEHFGCGRWRGDRINCQLLPWHITCGHRVRSFERRRLQSVGGRHG